MPVAHGITMLFLYLHMKRDYCVIKHILCNKSISIPLDIALQTDMCAYFQRKPHYNKQTAHIQIHIHTETCTQINMHTQLSHTKSYNYCVCDVAIFS